MQDVPLVLKRSAELAWSDRWWTLLGVAIQDALAASVLAPSCSGLVLDASTSYEPEIDRLLDDERLQLPVCHLLLEGDAPPKRAVGYI